MRPKRPTSISTLAMLVALGVSSPLLLAESPWGSVQAQDSPDSPSVRIDNLTRMAPINQALKKQYETQFPDAAIEIKTQTTDADLLSQDNQADLAAISRLLTPEEKAKGLVQLPVTREKIAIVVGKENAFADGLTIDQVVKIFRGEITDWSQVGGTPGPIRVIHRPIASNLQSTLQTYDLFRQASFEAGGKTVQLDKDDVSALTAELGSDGISYALASQILDVNDVRPISMYNTLPDDPRYPFSQPFTYVYQGAPTASTKTFLDYVASEPGQQAIADAKTQPALSGDQTVDSTSSTSSSSGKPDTTTSSPSPDNSQSGNTQSGSSESSPSSAADSNTSDTDVASSATDTAGEAQEGSNGLGWLPIGLMILVLGGVIGGVLKSVLAKPKPKAPPRPAPNYAEKIRPTRIQGTATQLQEPPEGSSSTVVSTDEPSSPLAPDNIVLGAATAAAAGVVENSSESEPIESEPQISEWVDITSQELQAQTRIQNPKTELQDTPPSLRGPKTQLQDPTATHLQNFDDEEIAETSSTQLQDSSPTQLQDPSQTQLQDPKQTWAQDEDFPEGIDPSPTQLQDSSPTQLQDPSQTQLQDPKQTWAQDEDFPEGIDPSPTQLQDSSPTQLQDPSQTQLQDPKQTWAQDEDFPEGIDPTSVTQLPDPKTTWIQEDES